MPARMSGKQKFALLRDGVELEEEIENLLTAKQHLEWQKGNVPIYTFISDECDDSVISTQPISHKDAIAFLRKNKRLYDDEAE